MGQLPIDLAELLPHHPHVKHECQPHERVRGNYERCRRHLLARGYFRDRLKLGLRLLREDSRIYQQQDGEADSFHSSLSRYNWSSIVRCRSMLMRNIRRAAYISRKPMNAYHRGKAKSTGNVGTTDVNG